MTQFFQSYLLGYFFWIGLSIGSLAVLMLHHLVGGRWGYVIRRPLEAAVATLPLMALLFVPFLFGFEALYLWARPEAVHESHHLEHLHAYLNVPFFIIRTAFYFVVWIGFGFILRRWSAIQDRDESLRHLLHLKRASAGGLLILVITATFAFVDWVMSLEPFWFSTLYGLMVFSGHALGTFAFMTLVSYSLRRDPVLAPLAGRKPFYDLGNLLLAFVLLWTYLNFSQYLLIWSANLAEEVPWYLARGRGGWLGITVVLALFHFALPFALLLARDVKRHARRLAIVAGFILAMRFVDLLWLIVPAFYPGEFHFHFLDLIVPLAIGALWLFVFNRSLASRPLAPLHDPRLKEILAHG